jgi:hypothetical protein
MSVVYLKFISQFIPCMNTLGDEASILVYHNLFSVTNCVTASYTIHWDDVVTFCKPSLFTCVRA